MSFIIKTYDRLKKEWNDAKIEAEYHKDSRKMIYQAIKTPDKLSLDLLTKWKDNYTFFFGSVIQLGYPRTGTSSLIAYIIRRSAQNEEVALVVDEIVRTHLEAATREQKHECITSLLLSRMDEKIAVGLLSLLIDPTVPYYHLHDDARVWRLLYNAAASPLIPYAGSTFWQAIIESHGKKRLEKAMIDFFGRLVKDHYINIDLLLIEAMKAP